MNGGQPLGPGFPDELYGTYLDVVPMPDGSVVYHSISPRTGRYMGRISASGAWELLSDGSWSSDPGVVATPIEHAHNVWSQMDLFPDPNRASGLLGNAARVDISAGAWAPRPVGRHIHGER